MSNIAMQDSVKRIIPSSSPTGPQKAVREAVFGTFYRWKCSKS
jgi:hypothetical protein